MIEWPDIDFGFLKKINPDTIGWIYLDDTSISYPVVKGRDDGYYLRHNFSCEESPHGCIYAEFEDEFPGKRVYFVGHNMKDNSMFAYITYYYYDKGFVDRNPVINLKTPDADYDIRIWGTMHFPKECIYMLQPLKDERIFREWKAAIEKMCPFRPKFDLKFDDDIAIFGTCRPFKEVSDGVLIAVGRIEKVH